jgi:hypothetical protein
MGTRTRFVVGSVCALAAISCGAGDSGAPGEGERGGYVLLDSDARQAGASIEVGDRMVTSALPIAVSAVDRVALVVAGNETPITAGRGELVYVQGASARVTHLQIGKQVAIDQLHLTGEQGAANELASQVGAKVAEDEDGWRLSTSDVFAASASAEVPEHLLAAAPVMLAQVAAAIPPNAAAAEVAAAQPWAASAPAVTVANVAASPASHALFTPAAACTGVGGTWRGRVYSERHQGYYDFTLQVRQHGASVTGTVLAEMWTGTTDVIDPPTTCAGERHATVIESASGTVTANGAMHFNSKTWSVQSNVCGAGVGGYSPDKFEIPFANGATAARAVVSDDAVWRDGLPMNVTRVSCQSRD